MGEAGDLIADALGIACFVAILAAALYFLLTRARNAGLLAPVVIGALLRLGVMLVAHEGSLSLGEGGFMHIDDVNYATQAEALAAHWRDLEFVNPSDYNLAGSYQFGFPVLVGAVYTLVGSELLAAKLVNVLAGSATILVIGLIARQVLGESASRRTAWLVALAPGVVWWSAPLLKEAMATLLVAGATLAILRLPRSLPALCALLAVLLVVRSPSAAILIVSLAIALLIAARQTNRPIAWRKIGIGALVVAAVVGVAILLISAGSPVRLLDSYVSTLGNMIDRYQGGNPATVPIDSLKSFVTPIPWAFDLETRSWDRGLYPGMWAWYALYPLAAVGCWRLRRRPELALLALMILLTVVVTSASSGLIFRQRSTVEPLILLLACAGILNWRFAARVGSASLLFVAVVAAVQSGSAIVGLVIAAGAAALFGLALLLPSDDLRRPLPPSPLTLALAPPAGTPPSGGSAAEAGRVTVTEEGRSSIERAR